MSTFGVAAKAVIVNGEGKYLFVRKSSNEDINPNTYEFPGGRIEFGESPEEALVREIKEEIGLDINIITAFNTWTFTKGVDFQLVGVDFLCTVKGGEEKLSEEHESVKWMGLEEIENNKELPSWILKTIAKAEKLKFLLSS